MARPDGSVYARRPDDPASPWVADVQWGKGPTAQRIRRSAPTREKAEALKAQLIQARDAGYSADVYGLTVQDLFERYMGAKQTGTSGAKRWAPSTLRAQTTYAECHILPALQDKIAADLTAHDCNYIIDRCRYDEDGDELVAMPQHVYRLLCAVLRWARDERLMVDISYLQNVRKPHYTPTPRKEFSEDEYQRLLKAARTMPDAGLWYLLFERGLRQGEARGLLRPNLDRAGRRIRLTHTVERRKGDGAVLAARLKTRNSYRSVPLSAFHLELINKQFDSLAELRKKAGATWREHGLLFPAITGAPMDLAVLHYRWRQLLTAAEVEYAPPHTARHTAVSRMLRSGIGLTEVAAIVGDTPATLLRTYAHARIETALPTLERLDARSVGE